MGVKQAYISNKQCLWILRKTVMMLSQKTSILAREAFHQSTRNLGGLRVATVDYNKVSDPIQGLFLNKLQDYAKKSKALGGGMVDAGAESETMLKRELDRLAKANGGTAEELAQFPTFTFHDPKLQSIEARK